MDAGDHKESARVLFLADTHLGFDLPQRPRVVRRRRGHDFFANLELALTPAREGQVDLVVHGGDLFYRSKVPGAVVERVLGIMAGIGVPVFLVPGNHERSQIPPALWAAHPHVHVFDRPRTFLCPIGERTLALAGFPFVRNVREQWDTLLAATNYRQAGGDARLLCLHQTVEGARVGRHNYVFRGGPDVIRGQSLPAGFAAFLCGHIHRAQLLAHDLSGAPLPAPVIYPGSIERTSFAERDEPKGYAMLEVALDGPQQGHLIGRRFVSLPVRPMVIVQLDSERWTGVEGVEHLRQELGVLDPDSIVRVELLGSQSAGLRALLTPARLRELAPASMNVELAQDRAFWVARHRAARARRAPGG